VYFQVRSHTPSHGILPQFHSTSTFSPILIPPPVEGKKPHPLRLHTPTIPLDKYLFPNPDSPPLHSMMHDYDGKYKAWSAELLSGRDLAGYDDDADVADFSDDEEIRSRDEGVPPSSLLLSSAPPNRFLQLVLTALVGPAQ
jgi:hypothetical protein